MKIKHLLVAFLLINSFANAQDIKKELLEMSKKYANAKQIDADISVHVIYKENSDFGRKSTQTYQLKKDGNQFFYNVNGSDFLFNEKCALMVNNREKYIFYSEHEKKPKFPSQNIEPNIDTLLENSDSINFVGNTEEGLLYNIFKSNSQISLVEIYINPNSHILNKITYFYHEEIAEELEKVEIIYNTWNLSPQFGDREFSEAQYITRLNGKIVPISKFQDYQVVLSN